MSSANGNGNGQTAIESAVRERYANASQQHEACLCVPSNGYEAQYLKVLPDEIIQRDYGCGNPSKWIREGETVGVVGESGSGKTTLGLAILRLIRSEGPVAYLGKRIDGPAVHNINVGALGKFLVAVKAGRVPAGATLVIESLDRISRAQVLDALEVFSGILNAGLKIATPLAHFLEADVLPGTGLCPDSLWRGMAEMAQKLPVKAEADSRPRCRKIRTMRRFIQSSDGFGWRRAAFRKA